MRASRWSTVLIPVLLGALAAACASSPAGMMSTRTGPGPGPDAQPSRLTCTAPTSLPGTAVHVALGDMGVARMMGGVAPMGAHMMLRAVPASVPAGQVSFVVGNMGWRTHEMVVLPLTRGQAAGQRVAGTDGRIDESGSLGEASASCAAGEGDGIRAGTVGWVTLTLTSGSYELVCNLPHHYADGMRQLLVVS